MEMLKKLFGFDGKKTTVRTEIMAGVTTFLAMAYILAVNPNILSETGMDKGALFTTTALILVGLMMMSSVVKVNFNDYSEAIPAFVCIVFMPLSYSISDGIVMGHLSYILVNLFSGNYKKVSIGMYILGAFFLLCFLL